MADEASSQAVLVDVQASPLAVAGAVLVPQHGDVVAVVRRVLDGEIRPARRDQRAEAQQAGCGLGAQAKQTGEHQVVERRVVVVGGVVDPARLGGVMSLADVGHAVLGLGGRVGVQERVVVGRRHVALAVVVEQVGHCGEGLGRGVRPARAVPMAAALAGLVHEPVTALLHGRRPVGGGESAGIQQLLPRHRIGAVRHIEHPGDESDLLPGGKELVAGVARRRHVVKELPCRVPEPLLHVAPEGRRPGGERAG